LDPETGKVIRERQARAPSDTKPAQMDSSFSSLEFGTQRSNQGTVERHVLRRAPRDTKLAQKVPSLRALGPDSPILSQGFGQSLPAGLQLSHYQTQATMMT